jgi:predicted metal-dependent phosphoesterase TrpH
MVAPTALASSAQNTQALKAVWSSLHSGSCPSQFNFHLHTIYSDGQLHPIQLIQQACEIGLQGLAITDHHSVAGFQQAQLWLEQSQKDSPSLPRPQLWTGVEITSLLLDIEVHILGYGFDPDHQALRVYLQGDRPQGEESHADRVIDALHTAGGLVVLAHPERYHRSAQELIPIAAELGIDGVETYYAYGNPKPWRPSDRETQRVIELSQTYRLYNTCGTDTHGLNLLQRI